MKEINEILTQENSLWFIERLLKKFPKAKIYLVGGMIRDIILNRPSKDYDFVISGVRPNTLEKYLKILGRVNLVGKNFGVFKFQPKNSTLPEPIDIALPRTEHSLYQTGGYREFAVTTDYRLPITQDLIRRDFTINALAWDIKNKRIIDPSGGLSDLAAEKIRAVGDAQQRFSEDYSRILRGLRLATQLYFEFEDKTWRSIKIMVKFLTSDKLPREVVARELIKTFEADPVRAFDVFELSGVFRILTPELLQMKGSAQGENYHSEGDVWSHTRLALEVLSSPLYKKHFPRNKPEAELILAVLLHDIGKPLTRKWRSSDRHLSFYGHEAVGSQTTADICERLRLPSYQGKINCDRLAWLVKHHLVITHTPPRQLKPTTLEKYFLQPKIGEKLLQLIFIDQAASISESGQPSLKNYYEAVELINEIKRTGYQKKNHLKIFLNGDEIMDRLKLKSGPQIGMILHQLRLAQLKKQIKSKKQAWEFLEKHYGSRNKSRKRRRSPR